MRLKATRLAVQNLNLEFHNGVATKLHVKPLFSVEYQPYVNHVLFD
jgi:hypothetical protein